MAEAVIIVNEQYLLSITKCKELSQIEEIDLSRLNLNKDSFDVSACNHLTSLHDLDLSFNEIEELPKDFQLPELKFLNISNNQLRTLNWIGNFPNICQLDIYDNFSLGVDERYKAIYLLKNIDLIDGKGVNLKGNFREQFGDDLKDKVFKLWKEDKYLKEYVTCKTDDEKLLVKEKFLEKARHKIRCGPNSLKVFRYWRIVQIVEIMLSNDDGKQHMPAEIKKTAKKRKAEDSNDNVVPVKSRALLTKTIKNNEYRYKPVVFLQCHSIDASVDDLQQQVWCCQFEPNSQKPARTTNYVATCGGDTVCITDCTTMKVKMKFQQTNEEFYTLAWTSLELVNSVQDNILACAGCLGYVHLIHTKQVIMYGRFMAHKKPIQTILFVPNHPTHLLTAGTDKRIVLWDIGIPSIPDYNFRHKKLAVFAVTDNPLRLIVPKNGFLLCGTERGLFCWNLHSKFPLADSVDKVKVYNSSIRLDFPYTNENSLVDGLVAVDDNHIATKLAQTGVIFLWKWSSVEKLMKVISSDSIEIPTIAELNWSNSKQFYININACRSRGALLSGDEDGHIWIYNAQTIINEMKGQDRMSDRKIHQATAIVPWPKCFRRNEHCAILDDGTMCNDVCSSWDMSYIVVASDNNMILIYKHDNQKKSTS